MIDKQELANDAANLNDLLDHIAWKDIVKPELAKAKEAYYKYLFQATLGTKVADGTGNTLTPVDIAGRIYGLEFVDDLLTRVLTQGAKALEALRLQQLYQH